MKGGLLKVQDLHIKEWLSIQYIVINSYVFNENSKLSGQVNDIEYSVLKHDKIYFDTLNNQCYYYVLKSSASNNIYVLFSLGIIFDSKPESNKFETIFKYLIEYLKTLDTNTIVLCGHSMGCSIAIVLAQFLEDKHITLFEKCIVVGSAPFKCLSTSYQNKQNIKIFVYGEMEDNKIFTDCYVNKSDDTEIGIDDTFSNYSPFTFVVLNTTTNRFEKYDGITSTQIVYTDYNYKGSDKEHPDGCLKRLHSWFRYYKALVVLYESNINPRYFFQKNNKSFHTF